MMSLLLCSALMAAEPDDKQLPLLKTFRKEFVQVTPGRGRYPKSFQMGSKASAPANEQPSHEVTFGYSFQVAKYEVPQNLWEAVMGSNPSKWKGPRNSVEMLTFAEAQQFCAKVTQLLRPAKLIGATEVVRLPTEAEWEYVARAGTTTRYSFGDDVAGLDAHGWFTGNAAGNDPPVGAKKPNAWGLYDIHGYLWEWCLDVGHENYQQAPVDGSAWVQGGQATRERLEVPAAGVMRGGSWKDKAEKLTSSYRSLVPKTLKDDAVGLRCILATEAKATKAP